MTIAKTSLASISTLCAALLLSACGVLKHDERVVYTEARSGSGIEVPPDLTRPSGDHRMEVPGLVREGTTTLSATRQREVEQAAPRQQPLETAQAKAWLVREGSLRWVVARGDRDSLWPRLQQFWTETGLDLVLDEPRLGILETGWAENVAHLPRGRLGELLGKIQDSGLRDRYRLRLEASGEAGQVDLYLTHQGLQENLLLDNSGNIVRSTWEWRPADPELEAEMRNRLLVWLNTGEVRTVPASEGVGDTSERSRARSVTEGGRKVLIVDGALEQVWRRTGLALDRLGVIVDARERSTGTYLVRGGSEVAGVEEKGRLGGWFGRLFRRGGGAEGPAVEDQPAFQVRMVEDGAQVRIVVLDGQGRPDGSADAERLHDALLEELK